MVGTCCDFYTWFDTFGELGQSSPHITSVARLTPTFDIPLRGKHDPPEFLSPRTCASPCVARRTPQLIGLDLRSVTCVLRTRRSCASHFRVVRPQSSIIVAGDMCSILGLERAHDLNAAPSLWLCWRLVRREQLSMWGSRSTPVRKASTHGGPPGRNFLCRLRGYFVPRRGCILCSLIENIRFDRVHLYASVV